MTQPNGIAFSPDGKTLYVSNSLPDMYVRAYDVGAGRQAFQSAQPDHLSRSARRCARRDEGGFSAGNIWTTGPGGVRIIAPDGKVLGQIIIPEIVANIGFAEDGKTVYLTGSTSLYRLHTKIAGEIPMYYRK